MIQRRAALLLLLTILGSVTGSGCSKQPDKPSREVPKDGLKGVTPKELVAPPSLPPPP